MAWTDRLLALALAALALGAAADARADSAREKAQRGKDAVEAGDYAAGCPLLAEAWQQDGELLGAGFTLATCLERDGKLASARELLVTIAEKATARGEARADEARTRADALAQRAATLTLVLPPEVVGAKGVVIFVDGRALTARELDQPLLRDTGPAAIRVTADGREPWSTTIQIPKVGEQEKLVVSLGAARAAPAPVEAPVASGPGALLPLGIVAGVLGLGGIGTGVALGVVAKGDYEAVTGCDASNVCTPSAADERRGAIGLADAGTGVFIAGAVLAAAGVTLVIVDRATASDPAPRAALDVGPAGARLRLRF